MKNKVRHSILAFVVIGFFLAAACKESERKSLVPEATRNSPADASVTSDRSQAPGASSSEAPAIARTDNPS